MKHKVIIMRCDQYDVKKISKIIKEGMEILNVQPEGRVLLKPNVVVAHPVMFPHAFTRSEFLDGVLDATKSRSDKVEELAVGERSGITLPTRMNFRFAGYNKVIKKHKVKTYYFDESIQVPRALKNKEALRKNIFVPKPVADADFLINLPKFKAHPWCRLTLSLKNFIGIQDDRHRLVDHNSFLEHKIADLQEVIQPKFIAVDAIVAGQETMLTPTPFDMGAIVMGTNSCAVDTVCCHMVSVDPNDLIHLRFVSQRGYGPMNLDEIEVLGDFPIEEIQEKTRDFKFLLKRVDDYFENSGNLKCTVGTFPEKHSPDYCWGGCPGALQEAVHIYKGLDPDVLNKIGKVRYVVGKVDHPLKLEEGEKVIFVGDCASWEGKIGEESVKIESSYRTTHEVDEKKTKSNDMLLKTILTLWRCFRRRNAQYVHAKGCTVSVGDHVHYLSTLGKIHNANFDSRMLIPINIAYLQMRFFRFFNHLKGFFIK
jgi:uncharacterized protein (DUF362 family)